MRLIGPILLLVCLSALPGCKKAPPVTADAVPATDATLAAASTATVPGTASDKPAVPLLDLGSFQIVSVTLGNALDPDKRVLIGKEKFVPKDTIYASVLSSGAHQGLTVSAKWTGPGNVPIANSEQALVPNGPTVTTFSIVNPDGWPVGDYQMIIAVNGQAMQTLPYTVQ